MAYGIGRMDYGMTMTPAEQASATASHEQCRLLFEDALAKSRRRRQLAHVSTMAARRPVSTLTAGADELPRQGRQLQGTPTDVHARQQPKGHDREQRGQVLSPLWPQPHKASRKSAAAGVRTRRNNGIVVSHGHQYGGC